MKKYAKMLSFTLALMLICMALTACGGNKKDQGTNGTTNATDTTNGNNTAASDTAAGDNAAGDTANDPADGQNDADLAGNTANDGIVGDGSDLDDTMTGNAGGNETIVEDAGNAVGSVVDDVADGVSDAAQGVADVTDDVVGGGQTN